VPRKKRRAPPTIRLDTPDAFLLDEFSHRDLRTWKRESTLLNQYRFKQFYELESLREIHRSELSEALRSHAQVSENIKGWIRIIDYRYSLEPLSAKGSIEKGGRFNIGKDLNVDLFAPFPALYLASNYETAYAERFDTPAPGAELQPHELALRKSNSFTNVALKGQIDGLFDLREPSSLEEFARIIGRFRMNKELQQIARQLDMKGPLLIQNAKDLHESLLGNWREMPKQYGLPSNSQVFARFLKQTGF